MSKRKPPFLICKTLHGVEASNDFLREARHGSLEAPQGRPTRSMSQVEGGYPQTFENDKSPNLGVFLVKKRNSLNVGLPGWGGRNRTSIWQFQKRMLLPAREDLQNPILSEFISRSNIRISRTVPNPRSPELWRELSHSEKNGRPLPIRSPEPKSEIVANTALNCQHLRTENRRLRRSWRSERDSNCRCDLPLLKRAPRSQFSHYIAANPAGFTLRLSFCRFHDASTNDISGFNSDSKKPSKTKCFQGLDVWLRG